MANQGLPDPPQRLPAATPAPRTTLPPAPRPSAVASLPPRPANLPAAAAAAAAQRPGGAVPHADHLGIGIDIGMTYTGATLYCEFVQGGTRMEPIPLDTGPGQPNSPKFPSLVYVFNGTLDDALVGKAAKDQLTWSADSDEPGKLYELFKRKLGSGERDSATGQEITPTILTRVLVKHVKHRIDTYLRSQQLTNIPISYTFTHPGTWDQLKLRALKEAIEDAGFTQYRVLDEPLAAAVGAAYFGSDKNNRKLLNLNTQVLVCDLGGGTLDLSLVTPQRGKRIQVNAATGGNAELGMSNLDKLLALWLMHAGGFLPLDVNEKDTERIKEETKLIKAVLNTPIVCGEQHELEQAWAIALNRRQDARWWSYMLHQCEVLKRDICSLWGTQQRWVFTFPDGQTQEVTRSDVAPFVKAMNAAVYVSTMTYLDELRVKAGVRPDDITHVVISGGGSYLPDIRKTLLSLLPTANIARVSEDRVMALVQHGAAFHAFKPGIVLERRSSSTFGLWVLVTELPNYPGAIDTAFLDPFGKTLYEDYWQFIHRGDPFPEAPIKRPMRPKEDGMREVPVPVLQGEDADPRKNTCIGGILMPLRQNARHTDTFNVFFEFKDDGIVQVRGEDGTGVVVTFDFDPDVYGTP